MLITQLTYSTLRIRHVRLHSQAKLHLNYALINGSTELGFVSYCCCCCPFYSNASYHPICISFASLTWCPCIPSYPSLLLVCVCICLANESAAAAAAGALRPRAVSVAGLQLAQTPLDLTRFGLGSLSPYCRLAGVKRLQQLWPGLIRYCIVPVSFLCAVLPPNLSELSWLKYTKLKLTSLS